MFFAGLALIPSIAISAEDGRATGGIVNRPAVVMGGAAGRITVGPIDTTLMPEWRPGREAAGMYAATRAGEVSIAVVEGRRKWLVNPAATFPMASTVKVMLMAAYLGRSEVADRPLEPSERDLLSSMIQQSDNDAATSVLNAVGNEAIVELAVQTGMNDFKLNPAWGLSRSSALDQALLMRRLPSLIPRRHWKFASSALRSVDHAQRWGIATVEHRGWRLHFKGGWGVSDEAFGGTVNHQIALFTRGKQGIAVSIMTQGNPGHEYGTETLAEVARRLLPGFPASKRTTESASRKSRPASIRSVLLPNPISAYSRPTSGEK